MNAPWKSGLPGNRDPFAADICDDNALDVIRPVIIELGWQPELTLRDIIEDVVG